MTVKFWGARGSIPTPITSSQIQSKIAAVVQRVSPADLATPDSRERFIASLPPWLLGTMGGNTPCVELKGSDGTEIALDAGSGLRALGAFGEKPLDNHYNLFLSHFHWDHIQGLPFFGPAFNPAVKIDVYSARADARDILARQMAAPYFPIEFESVEKQMVFHTVSPDEGFSVGGLSVHCCEMSHPGKSHAFSFEQDGKKFVYATDVELSKSDYAKDAAHIAVFKDADCIVLDSQYTVAEAYAKEHWGHSAFCYAIDFAIYWNIKSLWLFHHEPMYDDKKLGAILDTARWYAGYIERSAVKVNLAQEGLEMAI